MTPFQQKISKPIELPTMAKNIHVLMQSLDDDSLTYQQMAKVIKHYPDISARLIFLANSSWSAPISPISNIEQACSRLGTSVVKSISIAISISNSFDPKKCHGFSTVHFWTTSMLVTEGAGLLASKLPKTTADIEFEQTAQTSGLLHNLGLLWLADKLPAETAKAFQMVKDEPTLTLCAALKQSVGADYCLVGGLIGNQLKFPEILISVMEHHPSRIYQGSSWEMVQLVGLAANMAFAAHNQSDEVATNIQLEALGLDSSTQQHIFQQLCKNFEKTQDLVKILFKGRDNTC
jgi:HD-like signal output (HDOD) protein